jgi:hypothetical protein
VTCAVCGAGHAGRQDSGSVPGALLPLLLLKVCRAAQRTRRTFWAYLASHVTVSPGHCSPSFCSCACSHCYLMCAPHLAMQINPTTATGLIEQAGLDEVSCLQSCQWIRSAADACMITSTIDNWLPSYAPATLVCALHCTAPAQHTTDRACQTMFPPPIAGRLAGAVGGGLHSWPHGACSIK